VRNLRADAEHPVERALQREHAREQLAALSPGGSLQRTIPVPSAAVIEVRAAAMPCPQCGGLYRLREHTRPLPGVRRVDVACRQCSTPRSLWFRIVDDDPN
jgi:Ribonuclease G/E